MDTAHKWDTFYASDSRESFLHFTDEQIASILKHFPLAKTALDIGCGEGQLILQLETVGIATTGIDISKIALAEARKRVKGTLLEGDFEKYSFPPEQKFDLVFVKFVIAFIKDIPAFFNKIDDLLKQNGGFILLAPVAKQSIDRSEEANEIFIEQSLLDVSFPKHFSNIQEETLYAEDDKRLALFICKKD